jgi:1-acyl-sn-glycerol-3-phosphate acyltransferase
MLFPFNKKRKVPPFIYFLWTDLLIALNPYLDIRINGLENIDTTKTYIVVANHRSYLDIVLLYQTRMQFKWVAKEGLFKIPFLGWSLSLDKHISLAREKSGGIRKAYQEAQACLEHGISVLFFPEGTRGDTKEIGIFQSGAFKLAIKNHVPILPISIRGTENALPKGSWLFGTGAPLVLNVLEPIDVEGVDFATLRDLAYSRINAAQELSI